MRLLFLLICLVATGGRGAAQVLPDLIPFTDGARWGYADQKGSVRIPLTWDEAGFFIGDKAVVKWKLPAGGHVAALIDKSGRYIIPRSAGWNGTWQGWKQTALNATDSLGRWGLIDTNGHWLVAAGWEAAPPGLHYPFGHDSFLVVYRRGMAGLINRRGRVVVPCRWGSITTTPQLEHLGAFRVQDPDNMGGQNAFGLVDSTGRVIVPPHFSSIEVLRDPTGNILLQLVTAANNQPGNSHGSNVQQTKYLDLRTGRGVPAPREVSPKLEFPEPGGYISFGQGLRGLMDSAGKILIPCCSVLKVTPDTVYLQTSIVKTDSLIIRNTYLRTATLRPIGSPDSIILYREEPRIEHYPHYPHGYNHSPRNPPFLLVRGHYQERFYKDSFLYTVERYLIGRGGSRHYIVRGNVGDAGKSYFAVVDSNLRYIVSPRNEQIIHYNQQDDILTVVGRDERDGSNGYLLRTRAGTPLSSVLARPVLEAFRWKGNLYALSQPIGGEAGTYNLTQGVLVDSAGRPVPALRHLWFPLLKESGEEWMQPRQRQQVLPPGQLAGTDTGGRVHIVHPDGTPVYPALNGRYYSLLPVGRSWFVATGAGRALELVDIRGRAVLQGLEITAVNQALTAVNNFADPSLRDIPVPGLLKISARDLRTGKHFWFYLDDSGKAYYRLP